MLHTRATYGLESPNLAGEISAAGMVLTGFFFALLRNTRGNRRWLHIATLILFCCLGVILLTTGSRGGLLASVAGIAYVFLLISKRTEGNNKKWLPLALLLPLSLVILAFPIRSRLFNILTDKSVQNRISLWIGCSEAVFAAPLSGWGDEASGVTFIQWFQQTDRSELYNSAVSTPMSLAVDRGLPLLALPLFFCYFTIIFPLISRRSHLSVLLGGLLICFFTANLFSTLQSTEQWASISLFSFLAQAYLALKTGKTAERAASLKGAILLSTISCIAIYAVGYYRDRCAAIHVRLQNGEVTLTSNNRPAGAYILILPDKQIFGPFYGKAIRKFMLQHLELRSLAIVQGSIYPVRGKYNLIVCAGDSVGWGLSQSSEDHILFIAPRWDGIRPDNPRWEFIWPGIDRFFLKDFPILRYDDRIIIGFDNNLSSVWLQEMLRSVSRA